MRSGFMTSVDREGFICANKMVCPECGSGNLNIYGYADFIVTDGANIAHASHSPYYDGDSHCRCNGCNYEAYVSDFEAAGERI